MKLSIVLLLFAGRCAAQVVGVTATQAVIHYSDPAASCTVQVSQNASLTPLVYDVNPALYSGANLDTRPGSVISGTDHWFVVGKRSADLALDGLRRSRALQTQSAYYYSATCGGNTYTGQFTTANIDLGKTYPEQPPFDAAAFGNYGWPTINWNDQTQSYVDPMTGVLLKRATGQRSGL
jgi:hypothetical protein